MADCDSKTCKHCGADKPLDQFVKSPTVKSGRRAICKKCHQAYYRKRRAEHYEKVRAYEKKWHRERRLRDLFGISERQYATLLLAQGGVCAICGAKPERERHAVDHCHSSGAIRGLLCGKCNKGLGLFNDSYERLMKAAKYIERHAQLGIPEMGELLPYKPKRVGKSGVPGVRVENGCAFVAYVRDGDVERRVGRFKTVEEAAAARDRAILRLPGEALHEKGRM